MSTRTQAVFGAVVAFLVAGAVVYVVGRLIADLVVALVAIGAAGYAGLVAYRYLDGPRDRPTLPGDEP